MNGYNHFKNLNMLTGYAQSKGVPMPKAAVALTGVMLSVGGLGILTGVYAQYALLVLALFLLVTTFQMHQFWKIQDPMGRMGEEINFKKNLALLGAVLMLMSLSLPWAASLM